MIEIKGKTITDKNSIAQSFNKFFTNSGPILVKSDPATKQNAIDNF